MRKLTQHLSKDVIDFIAHCDWSGNNRKGFWLFKELYSNSNNIDKALLKCLRTLKRIHKETINDDIEFVLIDRVYELNYRVLSLYLTRRIKKEFLNEMQRINYYVQAIICGDVSNLEKHYELNKGL